MRELLNKTRAAPLLSWPLVVVAFPVLLMLLVASAGGNKYGAGEYFRSGGVLLQQPPINWPVYAASSKRNNYLAVPSLGKPGRRLWSKKAGGLVEFAPVVAEGKVFFQNIDGIVFARDLHNGHLLWKKRIGALAASAPAFCKGVLYFVTLRPGSAIALDATNGKVLWQRRLGARSESSPLVVENENKVVFGDESGKLWALHTASGKTVWRRQLGGAVKGAPAWDGTRMYVGDYSGSLWALQPSGKTVWRARSENLGLGRRGQFYATPALGFGRVYIGSTDHRVYSFVARSGKLAWRYQTEDYVYAGAVVAETPHSEPTVYVGSYDGTFYALDARSGRPRWERDLPGQISGAASMIGETLAVANLRTTDTFFYAPRTGKKIAVFSDGAYNPATSNGKVWVLAGLRAVYAYKAKDK